MSATFASQDNPIDDRVLKGKSSKYKVIYSNRWI